MNRLSGEISQQLTAYIKENYGNLSAAKIGEKFGVSDTAVRSRAFRLGLVEKKEVKPKGLIRKVNTGKIETIGNTTRHYCI